MAFRCPKDPDANVDYKQTLLSGLSGSTCSFMIYFFP